MSDDISLIKARKDEIIEYIASNELTIAISKTINFAKEFSTQEKINESIIYQQEYNSLIKEIRQLGGKTLEDTRKLQRLSRSLLEFLDMVYEEYDIKLNLIKNDDLKTFDIKISYTLFVFSLLFWLFIEFSYLWQVDYIDRDTTEPLLSINSLKIILRGIIFSFFIYFIQKWRNKSNE